MISSILLPDAAEPTAKSFVYIRRKLLWAGFPSPHKFLTVLRENLPVPNFAETFGGYVSLVVEILAVIPDMQVSFTTPLAEAAVVH